MFIKWGAGVASDHYGHGHTEWAGDVTAMEDNLMHPAGVMPHIAVAHCYVMDALAGQCSPWLPYP